MPLLRILSLMAALALAPLAQAVDACRYVPVATLEFRGDGPVKMPEREAQSASAPKKSRPGTSRSIR